METGGYNDACAIIKDPEGLQRYGHKQIQKKKRKKKHVACARDQ
jgi:hypothetical protein